MAQSGPLHGFRIVDLTSNISGPLATMILADQGADVIKVEPPQGGDHTRASANRRGGFSASFLNNNRNKRSIVLDLKTDAARAALLKLAATADVFVQNFRPGVAERMGLGEAAVRAVAPKIVYVSISGFGESGPYGAKPAYDPVVQALSSLATIQAGSDTERPRLVRTILPDKLTAVTASQAITAALLARGRTGEGQHVRLSMLDAVLAFLWSSDMAGQTFLPDEKPQAGNRQCDRPDLRHRRPLHQRRGADQPAMGGADARAGSSGMAGRSALPHAGAAAAAHRRPAAHDSGGAADPSGGGMAGTADRRGRAVRSGADAQPGDPSSAGNRQRNRWSKPTIRQRGVCARRAPRRGSLARRPASGSVRRRWANTRKKSSPSWAMRPNRSPR